MTTPYRKRPIRHVSGLWTSPIDEMPEPGVEVMAIIVHSGYGEESAQNVLLVHKEADDATWFTTDDESELGYDWDVIGWLPMQQPAQEALDATPDSVKDHIAALKENTRVLETRLRRSRLASKSLKGRYQHISKILSSDSNEVAKLKDVIASLTEQLSENTDELARATTRRDRAEQRTVEAYGLLRKERENREEGSD